MRHIIFAGPILSLAGCAQLGLPPHGGASAPRPTPTAIAPSAPSSSPVPNAGARTAEEFDTTSAVERAEAAAAPPPGGERALGSVVATLGDPADPGFWVRTGLIDAVTPGRVATASGRSAQVELRPAGSSGTTEASLATLRLLEAPLAGLVPLDVFASR